MTNYNIYCTCCKICLASSMCIEHYMNPNHLIPHFYLSLFYSQNVNDEEYFQEHRRLQKYWSSDTVDKYFAPVCATTELKRKHEYLSYMETLTVKLFRNCSHFFTQYLHLHRLKIKEQINIINLKNILLLRKVY